MTCTRCSGLGCLDNGEGVTVECIRCHGSGVCDAVTTNHHQHRTAVAHFYGTPSHALASAIARMGNVLEGGR